VIKIQIRYLNELKQKIVSVEQNKHKAELPKSKEI